jgi:hypothetical protein
MGYSQLFLKKKKPVQSLFFGNYKTLLKWKGIEFCDFRMYEYGDDVKNIDFSRSHNTWNILIKRFHEEREVSVFFLLDRSKTMDFWIEKQKKETLIETFDVMSDLALKNNDKIGIMCLDEDGYCFFSPKKWINYKQYLLEILQKNTPNTHKNEGFENNLKVFLHLPVKNAIVFLLTDKVGEISQRTLKMMNLKNECIYVNIFDVLENELPFENDAFQVSFFWKNSIFSLRKKEKILLYNQTRKQKIQAFRSELTTLDMGYIFLHNKLNIFWEISKFFSKR